MGGGVGAARFRRNPKPQTLNPKHLPYALNPTPCTLNPQPSTLNPQPLTLNPRFPARIVAWRELTTEKSVDRQVCTQHPAP